MPTFVYVTASADDKIIIYDQDAESGALNRLDEVEAPGRPAPMAVDPSRRFLYVARRDANELSSYAIDAETGGLSLLGVAPLESDPNYLATDRTGRWLLSAYYVAGRCAVHPIGEDGVAQAPPVEWRATGGGAHCMQTDRSNSFAFVPHIAGGNGPNAIFQFRFDAATGRLTPNDPPTVPQDGELGPRHFCFHPSLDTVYVSNEQGCSVTAYNFDAALGTLSAFQTVSTLPSLWSGRNSCAQIQMHPSGTMLFAPNRGHDSIACFAVAPVRRRAAGARGHRPVGADAARAEPGPGGRVHVRGGAGFGNDSGVPRERGDARPGQDRNVRDGRRANVGAAGWVCIIRTHILYCVMQTPPQ